MAKQVMRFNAKEAGLSRDENRSGHGSPKVNLDKVIPEIVSSGGGDEVKDSYEQQLSDLEKKVVRAEKLVITPDEPEEDSAPMEEMETEEDTDNVSPKSTDSFEGEPDRNPTPTDQSSWEDTKMPDEVKTLIREIIRTATVMAYHTTERQSHEFFQETTYAAYWNRYIREAFKEVLNDDRDASTAFLRFLAAIDNTDVLTREEVQGVVSELYDVAVRKSTEDQKSLRTISLDEYRMIVGWAKTFVSELVGDN